MRNYTEFPALANVCLEDSYVLTIAETPSSLSFRLDVVLTRSHPRYHDPLSGESHCYADATLILAEATKIEWISRPAETYRDASGEKDLENIDSLHEKAGYYEMTGDWGHVRIASTAAPRLDFAQ
ncbi:hypothetical protein GCM10027258_06070 [Amycolatopsis stemonae]